MKRLIILFLIIFCSAPPIHENKDEVELKCIRQSSGDCYCCDADKGRCLFEDGDFMYVIKKCEIWTSKNN